MRDSHEILRDVLAECGPKEIASQLGMSLSSIYKWAQPTGDENASGARNPLDRAADLLRMTGNEEVIQWLCHQAAGFYVRDPSGKSECRELLPATNEIIQEFADMLSVIAAAGANSRIDSREARMVRQRWEELKTVTESFVKCCEVGRFDELRDAGSDQFKRKSETPAPTSARSTDGCNC